MKLNYLTEEEAKMPLHMALLQITQGLQSCKTKGEATELLEDAVTIGRQAEKEDSRAWLEKYNTFSGPKRTNKEECIFCGCIAFDEPRYEVLGFHYLCDNCLEQLKDTFGLFDVQELLAELGQEGVVSDQKLAAPLSKAGASSPKSEETQK